MRRTKTEVLLDGGLMSNRDALWSYLKEQLPLPEYCGSNLDALYDALTDLSSPLVIILEHRGRMEAGLGAYGQRLLNVFAAAAAGNSYLEIRYREE